MSRPVVRAARLAALLITAVALAVPGAAAAKAKHQPCGKSKPAHANCGKKKGKKKAKGRPVGAAPVTVDLLDGSHATVDIPAVALPGGYVLPGVPTTRDIPLTGKLTGAIPGFQLG